MSRLIIEPEDAAPLKFHGWRVDDGGTVYAMTRPRRGLWSRGHEVPVGCLYRRGDRWVAQTLDGYRIDAPTQGAGGNALVAYVETAAELRDRIERVMQKLHALQEDVS
jgi:hypothetical protein